ncbi:MAG: patatin-like phospholipase family protein [Acidimicrobiales bacterium]
MSTLSISAEAVGLLDLPPDAVDPLAGGCRVAGPEPGVRADVRRQYHCRSDLLEEPMNTTGPRIGIVLGGGGIAGYAFHCAVLAALEDELGLDPRTAEILVGTSAGAIASAIVRGGVPIGDMHDRLLTDVADPDGLSTLRLLAGPTPKTVPRLWAGPGAPTMAVRELRRGRGLQMSKLLAALLPQGRSLLTPITEPLQSLHPAGWPSRPMWIPATDLRTGRLVVFGRDGGHRPVQATVAQAVEASAALPLFFAPVPIEGRMFIDGGLGSPFNADLLVDYPGPDRPDGDGPNSAPAGLDLVILLAPLSLDELRTGTPLSSAARSFPRRRLQAEVRRLKKSGTPTVVFQPSRAVARAMGLNPMDPDRVPAIIERSDRLVRRQLDSIEPAVVELLGRAAELPSPPDAAYPPI